MMDQEAPHFLPTDMIEKKEETTASDIEENSDSADSQVTYIHTYIVMVQFKWWPK